MIFPVIFHRHSIVLLCHPTPPSNSLLLVSYSTSTTNTRLSLAWCQPPFVSPKPLVSSPTNFGHNTRLHHLIRRRDICLSGFLIPHGTDDDGPELIDSSSKTSSRSVRPSSVLSPCIITSPRFTPVIYDLFFFFLRPSLLS